MWSGRLYNVRSLCSNTFLACRRAPGHHANDNLCSSRISKAPMQNNGFHTLAQAAQMQRRQELAVERWSMQTPLPMSMQDLKDMGEDDMRHRNVNIVHKELSIRLAHMFMQLKMLPCPLGSCCVVHCVMERYAKMVGDLEDFSPTSSTSAEWEELSSILKSFLRADAGTLQELMQELHILAHEEGDVFMQEVNDHLRDFFHLRIGTRFLVHHFLQSSGKGRPGYAGAFKFDCNAIVLAQQVAAESTSLCNHHLGEAPTIEIAENTMAETPSMCVPEVLSYMLMEVFKNACHAVVKRHSGYDGDSLPPVKCDILQMSSGLAVEIQDEGTGMSERQLARVGHFAYSTSSSPFVVAGRRKRSPPKSILSGCGVGIAICRLYAQYFGGDFVLSSKVGCGTSVRLHIGWSQSFRECLPT